MKTTPTEADREAARLFEPAPRMRAWFAEPGAGARACTVIDISTLPGDLDPRNPRRWVAWEVPGGACGWVRAEWLTALDVDDGPTQGAMLAQVESMRPGQAVSIVDRLHSLPGDSERRFAAMVEHDGTQTVATGPTRGAALVAARRACA